MEMKIKVRTIAQDNFALVGTEYDWVEHTIKKSFEKPAKWRVDKGDRIVVCDGKNQYLWLPKLGAGYKAGVNANFIEWFKILLDPETILLKEKSGTLDKGSKITMEEKNGEICLNITSKAQGNFINDYCKNKSIVESDNRREYIFDSKTKLIKGLRIFILDVNKETLILESEKIEFNAPVEASLFTINLPEGAEWTDLTSTSDIKSETFSNITSKRATEIVFDAMSRNDWDSVKDVFQQYNFALLKIIKMKYGGLKVIKIGESFKSGKYLGEFVPYEVILNDGSHKKHNIAIRNDNKNKVWLVDGGL
jgi:outer membrane lipoprotein-sorting protein